MKDFGKRVVVRLVAMAIVGAVIALVSSGLEVHGASYRTFGDDPDRYSTSEYGRQSIVVARRFDMSPNQERTYGCLRLEEGIKYIIELIVEPQTGNLIPPGWVHIGARLEYPEQPTGDRVLRSGWGFGRVSFTIYPWYTGWYRFVGGSLTGCIATLRVAIPYEDRHSVRHPFGCG